MYRHPTMHCATSALLLLSLLAASELAAARRSYRHSSFHRSECKPRRGNIQVEHKLGCVFTLPSQGCHGECLSSVKPFAHKSGFATSCSCCAPIQYKIQKVVGRCKGRPVTVYHPIALRCACRPC